MKQKLLKVAREHLEVLLKELEESKRVVEERQQLLDQAKDNLADDQEAVDEAQACIALLLGEGGAS